MRRPGLSGQRVFRPFGQPYGFYKLNPPVFRTRIKGSRQQLHFCSHYGRPLSFMAAEQLLASGLEQTQFAKVCISKPSQRFTLTLPTKVPADFSAVAIRLPTHMYAKNQGLVYIGFGLLFIFRICYVFQLRYCGIDEYEYSIIL